MLKVQEIREIIRLIDESSIQEFTYETTNGTKVSMKKGIKNHNNHEQNDHELQDIAEETYRTETLEQENSKELSEAKINVEEPNEESLVDYDYEIVSPMVGTFYEAPSPESEPYVRRNSDVESDTVVCIVEAMKLFNEIEAEVSGTIVDILVEDGELVEYGQPLFRVKKK